MDVSKMFGRTAAEGGESVPTKSAAGSYVIAPQKGNAEIVKDYLEEADELEDVNENVISEIETEIRAPIHNRIAFTTPVLRIRHPLSQRFHNLLIEIGDLHDRKQKDYGTADDPFANVRGATRFGLPAPMGAFIAMSDIMQRIESFCINGRLENEPLDNALRDMAVYSLIALVLHEEENGEIDPMPNPNGVGE